MKTLNEIIRMGVPVLDPAARSHDLDFFFDDEDEKGSDDLRTRIWLEVDLPIPLFGCAFTIGELGPLACDAWHLNREKEREASILAWVEAKGGWSEALKESPVLAIVRRDQLDFVDGWHRTKLANKSGHTTVRTLVGVQEIEVDPFVLLVVR